MVDDEEFSRWRQEAEVARRAAEVQSNAGLSNWACFAAEQAAQLALKALLHSLGRGAWGHDVVRLAGEVTRADIEVGEQLMDAVRRLARHYIPSRYPDAHPAGPASSHYGDADARQAMADADFVLGFVDEARKGLDE